MLDHLGNPEGDEPDGGPWAGAVRALAALPNTICKLSGVLSEAFLVRGAAAGPDRGALDPLVRRYFDTSLRAFGPHRLMYGSDWPPCTLTSSYADVLTAARMLTGGLSPAEQAAVFGATARRVYGLDRTGPDKHTRPARLRAGPSGAGISTPARRIYGLGRPGRQLPECVIATLLQLIVDSAQRSAGR